MPSHAVIEDFLAQRRIAIVGVSRTPSDFSVTVLKAFRRAGYEVTAVNAAASPGDVADGVPLVTGLDQAPDGVDGVLVMVPAAAAADVVRQALALGVRRVWLHRGGGVGSVSEEAVAAARNAGADVVDGACPLMFLGEPGLVHRLHKFMVRKQLTA